MFAIVDIETTGGFAAGNGITEISIRLYDGREVVRTYETLVNPQQPIPRYIQSLTGITPGMLAGAPVFEEIAAEVFGMLQGHVFIAHNVNFDYSFLKHHLAGEGYVLDTPKLCTVRLSRKIFPGLPSYSLGKLCRELGIPLEHRHRAGGDAGATVLLFALLLSKDEEGHIRQHLKRNSPERFLPMHIPEEQFRQLPDAPGVYYFYDRHQKVIYVGKARNLRKRVTGHFSNNNPGRQRQEFLRNIHRISFETCTTELMALILESVEIRRLWPAYNRSQKRFEQVFGLYAFEDQRGYLRLAIEKRKRHLPALHTFHLLVEGYTLLRRLVKDHDLCPKLCFLQTNHDRCIALKEGSCRGACERAEPAGSYNHRVKEALFSLQRELPTFAILDKGREENEQCCFLVEQGHFYGMGYLPAGAILPQQEEIRNRMTPYPDNEYIRNLLRGFAVRYPSKVVTWN